jgi:hypothetical protein
VKTRLLAALKQDILTASFSRTSRSRLPSPWITACMHAGDDNDAILNDPVEQAVGEPVQERSARFAMEDGKLPGIIHDPIQSCPDRRK